MNVDEWITQVIKTGNIFVIGIVALMLVIYFFIQRYFDYNKHKNELVVSKELTDTLGNILSSIKDVSASMSSISAFLTRFTDSIINKDKDKCRIAIQLSFSSLEKELFLFGRETIIANNIDKKKEYILAAISKIVNAQYYELYSYLSYFEINNHRVSYLLKEEWKHELEQTMTSIIFDINLDTVNRINVLETRLSAQIDDYTTYTHNKTFNE